ncbi:MAG TPA: hypothetical protein VJH88_05915 [Candidatus Nanoarchaeia archaeon]|nr:hypothetical protein [Candidatus Nanoarchaeia archaeon]
MLSKKDIVEINKEFHGGQVVNGSSLEYALDTTRRSKNWLKAASMICRSVLIDHVFEDGNKRTAAAVIMTYIDMQELKYNKDKVNRIIINMLKNNTTDIRKIERLIKDVIE